MTSTEIIDCQQYTDIQVRGYNSSVQINLPKTFSRNFIPAHRSHIPTRETAGRWPHLRRIEDKIPSLLACDVSLLIGYNCPQAFAPKDFIRGSGDDPFAQETELGWSIVGRTKAREESEYTGISHMVIAMPILEPLHDVAEVHYVCRTTVKEEMVLPQVAKILESDFPEKKEEDRVTSQDDLKFMNILEQGIHRDTDGYYEMPLPFKNDRPNLPNNETLARRRLEHLERRLKTDQQYHRDYKNFMDIIIERGDAEEVPDANREDKAWYIPHHGVYHAKKKDKIRVVFDCSSRYRGTALNDHLLQGPDLLNPLIGVLCRFREDEIAVMGEIEKNVPSISSESR